MRLPTQIDIALKIKIMSALFAVQGKSVGTSRVRGNGPFKGNNVAHVVLRAHWMYPLVFLGLNGSEGLVRRSWYYNSRYDQLYGLLKMIMIVCTKMPKRARCEAASPVRS